MRPSVTVLKLTSARCEPSSLFPNPSPTIEEGLGTHTHECLGPGASTSSFAEAPVHLASSMLNHEERCCVERATSTASYQQGCSTTKWPKVVALVVDQCSIDSIASSCLLLELITDCKLVGASTTIVIVAALLLVLVLTPHLLFTSKRFCSSKKRTVSFLCLLRCCQQ